MTARHPLLKIPVKLLEWVVIAMMAALCLDVLWGVFSRFILKNQSSWTEELATVLLIWVSLLGAALAFAEKAHLGVDYLVGKMVIGSRRLMAFVSYGIVGFFAGGVLVYGGLKKSKALFLNFITALMAVLGGITGFYFSSYKEISLMFLLPFAAGGFIYIAASDLIPEIKKEVNLKKSLLYFSIFVLGIVLMYGVKFLD